MATFKNTSKLIDAKTNTIPVPNGGAPFGSSVYGWAMADVFKGVKLESKAYVGCSGLATTSASTGICTLSHFPPASQGQKVEDAYAKFLVSHMQTDAKIYLFGNVTKAQRNPTLAAVLDKLDLSDSVIEISENAVRAMDASINHLGVHLDFRAITSKTIIPSQTLAL
ncbi:MAG: hypothetical protein ACPGOV_14945 [Magnetovibrionaceae bacterium]